MNVNRFQYFGTESDNSEGENELIKSLALHKENTRNNVAVEFHSIIMINMQYRAIITSLQRVIQIKTISNNNINLFVLVIDAGFK